MNWFVKIFMRNLVVPWWFVLSIASRFPVWLIAAIALQVLCATCASAQYLVEVIIDHRLVIRCDATGADFGDDVMAFSFGPYSVGCVFPVQPSNACTDTEPPQFNHTACISNFALVPLGNCTFSEKAYHVQKYYNALIMYNDKGHAPIPMPKSDLSDNVTIPVVMVNYGCMENLIGNFSADKGYLVTLKASPGYYELIKYLVPFVVIVGFCFIVLFISLVIRLWKERRRQAKKRLSRSNLKKIPTKRYAKNDREVTCAICLEDFIEGDKLRVLGCRHAYHCKCIDPWLTKNRKVCPVCKRKVGPSSNNSSDSDSERASTFMPLPSRENEYLIGNEQPIATSSSAEFPYPPSSLTSIPSSTTNERGSALSRLANMFNVGRSFQGAQLNRSSDSEIEEIGDRHRSRELLVSGRDAESRRTRLAILYDRLTHGWRSMMQQRRGDGLPHSRLEDEDVSTSAMNEELEDASALFEYSQDNHS